MKKKISISTYNNLTQLEKYDLVFTKGNFVNYYLKSHTRFALYSLFMFFVEIEYSIPQNKILKLVAFVNGKLLDRYWILTDLNKNQ